MPDQDIKQACNIPNWQATAHICLKTFLENAGAQVEVSNNILCQERYQAFYYVHQNTIYKNNSAGNIPNWQETAHICLKTFLANADHK